MLPDATFQAIYDAFPLVTDLVGPYGEAVFEVLKWLFPAQSITLIRHEGVWCEFCARLIVLGQGVFVVTLDEAVCGVLATSEARYHT